MIFEYIEKIAREERQKGSNNLYIRSVIKEYLQVLVLEYIYTSNQYKSLFIFTGGTCLRHIHGLERLSEDLDFDTLEDINTKQLALDIQKYFNSKMQYKELNVSLKQQGRQVLLKFPCLQKLGLANQSESDFLYIKMDMARSMGGSFNTEKTSKNLFNSNFVSLHYDLPSLFAGKVSAILTRNLLKGKENKDTIKGRDFFDLLWFLKKGVRINLKFLQERIGEDIEVEELEERLEEKVSLATSKFKTDFRNDLLPFVQNSSFVNDYVENYHQEFKRLEVLVI